MLLNSQFVLDQAQLMAARVAAQADSAITDAELPSDAALLPTVASPWSYGYGTEQEGVFDFTPLPHWTGSSWQGGESLPDETLGWCLLNSQGGHPHQGHAAIRCWTASSSAEVRIEGQLGHGSDQGDGIRGRIYSESPWIAGRFSGAQRRGNNRCGIGGCRTGRPPELRCRLL